MSDDGEDGEVALTLEDFLARIELVPCGDCDGGHEVLSVDSATLLREQFKRFIRFGAALHQKVASHDVGLLNDELHAFMLAAARVDGVLARQLLDHDEEVDDVELLSALAEAGEDDDDADDDIKLN